jgi:DNA replication and repair protein RecF
MNIESIHLKNFRCFSDLALIFKEPFVVIKGKNGSGKTSLLEALYYACYLRSFRTHITRELVAFSSSSFFIKTLISNHNTASEIHIGMANSKRLVKIDGTIASSYKQLLDIYRCISITENDLLLIKGTPEVRRQFMDQALSITDPSYRASLKKYYRILDQRNAFFNQPFNQELYEIWTSSLWQVAQTIKQARLKFILDLQEKANQLLTSFIGAHNEVSLLYDSKQFPLTESYDCFRGEHSHLLEQELRYKRTLFGIHLDDLYIGFQDKTARLYSSRGQQKLVIVALKLAHPVLCSLGSAILLLDDFITDFDERTLFHIVPLISSFKTQIFFTSPSATEYFSSLLKEASRESQQIINIES